MNTQAANGRTLVFCTAHVDDETVWDGRYRRWLEGLAASGLEFATALLVDDGSQSLPGWPGLQVIREGESIATDAPRVLYHFEQNLGRRSLFDFPGWYRSFAFASEFAEHNGFDKAVHLESDAFIISRRLARHINELCDGWIALWCPLHGFPEITIQVMAGSGMAAFRRFCATVPGSALAGHPYENQIPFTGIEKGFVGDRYGERLPYVPVEADYVSQAPEADRSYFWWLGPAEAEADVSGLAPGTLARHNEILRFDRGRLQRTIYGLQDEVSRLQHQNAELRAKLDASLPGRVRRFLSRVRSDS